MRHPSQLSDSHFNYVDRVRIRDQGTFNGPGRTGGWRHRSLSSIDLSSNSSRSKDHHTCAGQEVYSRLNGVRDYEDFYAVNNKVKKNNSLYDHVERRTSTKHDEPTTNGNTVCSLRRTRSLAVIREETYPDLRVTGVRNRRSQLIPRAKLIEKDVFREKYRKKNSEGDTDSVKSHSSQGSEDFYTNLKRLDIIGVTTEDIIGKRRKDKQNWATEKSDDLDSLDSSYFRNSSHQLSTSQDPSRIAFTTDTDCQNYTAGNSHLADTTTSNSDYSPEDHLSQSHSNNHKKPKESKRRSKESQLNESDSFLGIKLLDDVLKSEDPNLTSENNTINSKRTEGSEKPVTKLVIKLDGTNLSRRRSSSSLKTTPDRPPPPPINDFYKTRDEIKSIVSYDSIYLSSEAASDEDDNLYSKPSEVYVSNNHSGDTDTVEISLEDYDEITDPTLKEYSDARRAHNPERAARANIDDILEDENCLDTLYSQVNKSKPKIVGVEPKTSFASSTRSGISDKASIVRSERHSVLSSNRTSLNGGSQSSNKGHNRYKKNPKTNSAHQNQHYKEKRSGDCIGNQLQLSQDNHYYSLPDINIGKLLSDSEKIDAKLRLSSEVVSSDLNLSSTNKGALADYDSALNYTSRQHRRRQRENCELILSEPNPVDELPREVPSIEVQTPYKDPNDFEEIGPTSLDTFGSDQESLQPNLYTVSIGGKQVIVDEVDKLNLKKGKGTGPVVRRSNSLRDNTVLKESISNRDSEITAFCKPKNNTVNESEKQRTGSSPEKDVYEKDIKDYFEERLLKKVNEVNDTQFNNNNSNQNGGGNHANKKKTLQQTANRHSAAERIPQKTSKTKAQAKSSTPEMPRPQIMNVVHSANLKQQQHKDALEKDKMLPSPALEQVEEGEEEIDPAMILEAQQEFHEKVDSIRCYWSKLATSPEHPADEGNELDGEDANFAENEPRQPNVDGLVKMLEKDAAAETRKNNKNKGNLQKLSANNFLKHLNRPTVEIIEFDDKTQTAVVKARSSENVFDHVRYKVVKTETFQKNLQVQKHKEAQFDGLMQYLQDYSFQELLANNNVVIIEPVRTKIEIISEKPVISSSGNKSIARNPACKITGVRVNKELLDEELPCPDTVRNVRKLFEGSSLLRLRSVSKDNIAVNTSTLAIQSALGGRAPVNGAARNTQHSKAPTSVVPVTSNLAVDTTSGGVVTHPTMRSKWDAASLSSGVSSGELSSPCECTDLAAELGNHASILSGGEDQLDDGKCCGDPSYVSQDVLEKIRARGSTVTYYGGKVFDKRSSANGVMQDIYKNRCIACQPLNCPEPDEVNEKMNFSSNANYLGVRFKLVKSNSCSSRLELVGTGKINSLQQHQQMRQQISQDMKRDDDKRRRILHRLHQQQPETGTAAAATADGGAVGLKLQPQKKRSESSSTAAPAGSSPSNEKCVKQIVEQLETTRSSAAAAAGAVSRQSNGATPPRIIDSKCIEKGAVAPGEEDVAGGGQQQRIKPPKQLVINPAAVVTEANGRAAAGDSPSVVTVNNSISIAGAVKSDSSAQRKTSPTLLKSRQESIYATAKELLQQKQQQLLLKHKAVVQEAANKTKVVRNRNVDLALSIVKNHKNAPPSPAKDDPRENGVPSRDAKESPLKTAIIAGKEQQKPVLTTFSQQHQQLKQQKDRRPSAGIKAHSTARNVKAASERTPPIQEKPLTEEADEEAEKQPLMGDDAKAGEQHNQRMIKWSSLHAPKNFDEKFYVSNDAKLKQKKIYDEMEFEEFEVYDTATGAITTPAAAPVSSAALGANECYDSLNSNK